MATHVVTLSGVLCEIQELPPGDDAHFYDGTNGGAVEDVTCPGCRDKYEHILTCPACKAATMLMTLRPLDKIAPHVKKILAGMLMEQISPQQMRRKEYKGVLQALNVPEVNVSIEDQDLYDPYEDTGEHDEAEDDNSDDEDTEDYDTQNQDEEETQMQTQNQNSSKKSVNDVPVTRTGDAITVPEGIDLKDAANALLRRAAEEEQVVDVSHDFNFTPPEGALALLRSLRDLYGFVSPLSSPGFFGPNPPTFLTLEVGPNNQTEQVPWGTLKIPGLSGTLSADVHWRDGAPYFRLSASIKGKEKAAVQKIADHMKARTDSIYRGKAIYAKFPDLASKPQFTDFFPRFMDLPEMDDSALIFSRPIEKLIRTTLFTPIEHTDLCLRNGITIKRGILLEGPFGTGKTLTAKLTALKCVKNGWTFIYLDNVRDLPRAISFAKQYQPAVIFAEDIDQVLSNPDQRDEEVNKVLNSADGIDTKGLKIITVLTTNQVQKITKAMLRPGRLDTVVEVRPPDAEAAGRMVRQFAGQQLAENQDLNAVGVRLAGCIPAMIQEVVERSKLGAVARAAVEGGDVRITAEDLEVAAMSMEGHMRLLETKVPDDRSDIEKAADILGKSLRSPKTANGSSQATAATAAE